MDSNGSQNGYERTAMEYYGRGWKVMDRDGFCLIAMDTDQYVTTLNGQENTAMEYYGHR